MIKPPEALPGRQTFGRFAVPPSRCAPAYWQTLRPRHSDGRGRADSSPIGQVRCPFPRYRAVPLVLHGSAACADTCFCPKQGKGAALILPTCNTEAMNLHLAEIALMVAPGAHAVLLVDQTGWHLSARLVIPTNITILPMPPKSPELNPVENIWQFMRDNWLSNRVFKSYDDLVDHCCEAWNKLVDQPWRIMSIGLRQWAHGF